MSQAVKLVVVILTPLLAINAVLWWPISPWGTAVAVLLMVFAPIALREN